MHLARFPSAHRAVVQHYFLASHLWFFPDYWFSFTAAQRGIMCYCSAGKGKEEESIICDGWRRDVCLQV